MDRVLPSPKPYAALHAGMAKAFGGLSLLGIQVAYIQVLERNCLPEQRFRKQDHKQE